MSTSTLKARAELPDREWIEFEVTLSLKGIVESLKWHVLGCRRLIVAGENLANALKNQSLNDFTWSPVQAQDKHHSALLTREIVMRLQGRHVLPYGEAELCHCRKVPTLNVDQAIVLGAHTPEKVRNWTSASSQCGSCRPDVQKILAFRLGQK